MWLHNYLLARSELPSEDSKTTSISLIINWATFGGVRQKILRNTGNVLESLNKSYMDKFASLPENMFTRAMILFGLILGPWAPIPIILCDLIALLAMAVTFIAGWIIGGAITLTLAGLAWVVGGNNASSSVFDSGVNLTENIMCVILSLLSLPAGLINLVGMIPSVIIELITECINYACVSAVHLAYNPTCVKRLEQHATQKPSEFSSSASSTKKQHDFTATNAESNNLSAAATEKQSTLLFQSEKTAAPLGATQHDETVMGEVLRDIGNQSLPANKLDMV